MSDTSTDLAGVAGGFSSESKGSSGDLPLFRPEALAAAADNGMGRPIALLPLSWGLLAGSLAAMVVALAVFLFLGTYSRKESAVGIVRTVGGDVRISVPTAGIVARVLATEGTRVRAGDTLLVIDTARSGVDGRPLNQSMIESLDRELADLGKRLQSLDANFDVERRGGPARLNALEGERAAALAQQAAGNERIRLAEDALARLEPVAQKGFISGEAMRRRKEELIVLRQGVAEARGAQSRVDGQISELRTTFAQRPLSLVQQRGDLQDLIGRARRDRENYAAQRGFAVKSPTSGVVSALQATPGQAVDPQRTLMTVSSPGAAVSAEIFVPSRAVGFLEAGQQVKVRYDAFPYQRFGSATATIRAISSTVLRPEEVQAAIKVEEPVYRVLIDLQSDRIRAYGRSYRIRPGLALTANIVLDRRSFAEWLLDPILALRGKL